MAIYQIRHKSNLLGGHSIDCWFERAIRFKPDDAKVHLVYGIYTAKAGRKKEALEQYKTALHYDPNLAEAHYNLGLLYVEMAQYDAAYTHAVKAYDLGYPLPGLRTQLIEAGAWPENKHMSQKAEE